MVTWMSINIMHGDVANDLYICINMMHGDMHGDAINNLYGGISMMHIDATVDNLGSKNMRTFQELGQFGDELGAACVTINETLDGEAVLDAISRTK